MRRPFLAGLISLTSAFLISALATQAADIRYACENGTALVVAFSANAADITLPDGAKVSLPQQVSASGFWYSNGRYELRGKGDDAQFTIGRMTPIPCKVDGQPADLFDRSTRAEVDVPAGETGFDKAGKLTCLRYPNFALKQLDLGEKGAAGLFIAPSDGPCKLDAAVDRKIIDERAGYLWGAVGPFAFFRGADGWNGGMPFIVYDARSLTPVLDDVVAEKFDALTLVGEELTLRYRRTFAADCSLPADPQGCAVVIREKLGLAADRPMPDCRPAYKPAIDADPAAAATIEAWPSVIDYPVERKLTVTGTTLTAVDGDLTCRPSM
ncbi:MAG: MliC family protein [Rhizobium sp.]|nr:MliC family protein [Rhizobium sp.]